MTEADLKPTAAIASQPAIVAAIGVSIAGVAAFSVLPLTVGALADLPGLDPSRAGYLAAGDLIGFAVTAIAAALLGGRLGVRQMALIGLAVAVGANLLSLAAGGFNALLATRLLAGAGAGFAYAASLTVLARAANVDRAFAFMIAAQIAFQVIALLVLSRLIAAGGAGAVFLLLAGVSVLSCIGAARLSPNVRPVHAESGPSTPRRGVFSGLGAIGLFGASIGAVWAYMEFIGVGAGLSASFVGEVLAISLALSALGALGAAWLANRAGRVWPIALAVAVQIAALVLLAAPADAASFIAGAVLYSFAWAFAPPYFYAILANVDASGRAMMLAPAAQAAGAGLGPLIAAAAVQHASLLWVNAIGAAALTGALACAFAATRGSASRGRAR